MTYQHSNSASQLPLLIGLAGVAVGMLAGFFPSSLLPLVFVSNPDGFYEVGLATFFLLLIGLTFCKLNPMHPRWLWLILLAAVAFFLVTTQALISDVLFAGSELGQ